MDGDAMNPGNRNSTVVDPIAATARKYAGSRLAMWIFGVVVITVAAIVAGFLLFASRIPTDEPAAIGNADGMVVLTGGTERVADAMRLLRGGHAHRLLITGVGRDASGPDIARRSAESIRLIQCCVDLGYAAQNTAGNAAEAARWAREHGIRGSIIVVTSNYHMPRALVEMHRRFSTHELLPYPVVPERLRGHRWWNDPELARLVAAEYFKYLYASVRAAVAPIGSP